ncbi:Uncharacterised protein [Mycobacterium tuberculosis]|uniref:Uncharacterized protein n=1 Tax=Mycobacterium tuberculosis TaxID=1773 RepID=A0A655AUB6_MYCTX|nr:Uncharacterised protein [Mycobacterium tuberculosis]CKU09892.1 Uncharacterised protein [Mycobacterium tuberculosis]CLQ80816.1 Uncharacterised protein [Mycobacterium tuberculosis]
MARAVARSPFAANTIVAAELTIVSGCGPSQPNNSAACPVLPSWTATLAATRTAAARSVASGELSRSSASVAAAVQSPVRASASARRTVNPLAPAWTAARYSRAQRTEASRVSAAYRVRMSASRSSRSPCSASRSASSADTGEISSCERNSEVSTSWWCALPTI